MKKTITKPERLEAVVTPPGDKSISHRAAHDDLNHKMY